MRQKLPLTLESIKTNPQVRKDLLQLGVIVLIGSGLIALYWVLESL